MKNKKPGKIIITRKQCEELIRTMDEYKAEAMSFDDDSITEALNSLCPYVGAEDTDLN